MTLGGKLRLEECLLMEYGADDTVAASMYVGMAG